ncbi:MAG TPA: hypothetical protein PLE71_17280 [Flavobacteriales bacterium]|nr:hypothetical protein [Flavobacteriales bacterium]HRA18578.1 hypothetical protein [Flavobacteriales bacterium]
MEELATTESGLSVLRKRLTDAELLQRLANATATNYSAAGKEKARMNENLSRVWSKEMKRRELQIPSDEELLKAGQFNGIGSM